MLRNLNDIEFGASKPWKWEFSKGIIFKR